MGASQEEPLGTFSRAAPRGILRCKEGMGKWHSWWSAAVTSRGVMTVASLVLDSGHCHRAESCL